MAPYAFVNQLNTSYVLCKTRLQKQDTLRGAASHFSLDVFIVTISVGIAISKDTQIVSLSSQEAKCYRYIFHLQAT